MQSIIKGKDVLDALKKLNAPANLAAIVDQLVPNYQESKSKLIEMIKSTLETGIEFGYIKKVDENKYQVENFGNQNMEYKITGTEVKDNDSHEDNNASSSSRHGKTETHIQQDDNTLAVKNNNEKYVRKTTSTKKKIIPFKRKYMISSSEDDDDCCYQSDQLQDQGYCCGSRFRRRRQTRSRSRSKRLKSYSRRRTRRR